MVRRCSFCGEPKSPSRPLFLASENVAICPECARLAVSVASEEEPQPDIWMSNVSKVMTNDARRGNSFGWVEDASIVVKGGRISWIGEAEEMPDQYRDYPELDCEGRMVIPGMVDAGTRILGSLHTELPDSDRLLSAASHLSDRALAGGVTTMDLRVGGTDDPTLDLCLLAVARELSERWVGTMVITWQCSARTSTSQLAEMVPAVSRIATFANLVCVGRDGLDERVDAVAPLPVRVTCLSRASGHTCLQQPAQVISADAGMEPPASVTVVGPSALLGGQALSGDLFALASECDLHGVTDPGLGLALLLAVEIGGFGPEQALWAATRGGALALGEADRGILKLGAEADLVVYDTDSVDEIVADPSNSRIHQVIAEGLEIPGIR